MRMFIDVAKMPTSVEELNKFATDLLEIAQAVLGPRSSTIIMLGMPIADSEHDRFTGAVYGPCLSARGLLAWGTPAVIQRIDAGDTSKNGKPHP